MTKPPRFNPVTIYARPSPRPPASALVATQVSAKCSTCGIVTGFATPRTAPLECWSCRYLGRTPGLTFDTDFSLLPQLLWPLPDATSLAALHALDGVTVVGEQDTGPEGTPTPRRWLAIRAHLNGQVGDVIFPPTSDFDPTAHVHADHVCPPDWLVAYGYTKLGLAVPLALAARLDLDSLPTGDITFRARKQALRRTLQNVAATLAAVETSLGAQRGAVLRLLRTRYAARRPVLVSP
jgi:hypothetical protein